MINGSYLRIRVICLQLINISTASPQQLYGIFYFRNKKQCLFVFKGDKVMKKLLSVMLALIICLCQLSVVSVASFDETDSLSLDKFTSELVKQSNHEAVAGEIADNSEAYFSNGIDSPEADDEDTTENSTLRLVVKSSEKLDELDSLWYVYGYNDLHILQFDNKESFENAMKYYNSLACVEYAEEDGILTAAVVDEGVVVESAADYPTSVQSNLFGYTNAKVNSSTEYDVNIAVIDSGVQHDHEFLAGRVVDSGFNAVTDNGSAYDDRGHGTHIAGIIVANTKDNVTVHAYKVLNASGAGSATQVSLGIDAAIEDGMDIINLSVQMEGHSSTLYNAVKKAYDAGITVVVSAGNAGVDLEQTPYSPGSFDEAISVMSCSNTRRISSTSNYGTPCDFAAPGENILSTYLDNTYKITSGTSMAAPFICAAAAYLLSADNTLTPDGVYDGLLAEIQWCYGSPRGRCVYPDTKTTVSGKTATPVFELTSCSFLGSMMVGISCADTADIFYSVNGDVTFKQYTGPFEIYETSDITAFAVSNGKYNSESATVKYTLFSGNASDFTVDETDTLIAYNGSAVSVSVPSYVNGNKVANVAKSAFSGNTTVSSVVFEASLTTIGEGAFVGCSSLSSVKAPGVTVIEKSAFKECENLRTVTSNNLTNICEKAFYGCPLLSTVTHDKVEVIGANAFENTEVFTSFSSAYVTQIGAEAFKNSAITSLGIGSATDIGDYAFSGCSGLTEVVLTSAKTMGAGAFQNCNALTTVSAPALESVSQYCFNGCTKLATVSFGVAKLVDKYAFSGCNALHSYSGFAGVEEIRAYAFEGTNISSVSSSKLTRVEPYSFSKFLTSVSTAAKSVDLSMFEGSENIHYFSFGYATELIFPKNGLASLYPSLKSLKASKITELPDNAFNGCSSFDTHSFSNLTSVGANAFKGTALTEISFSALVSAGEGAFSNMTKLTNVNLPKISEITTDMFLGDTAVTSATFNGIKKFSEGVSVKDMFPNITTFTAHDVEVIPAEMFMDCTKLSSVSFSNLYTIGARAFQNCALKTIFFYADTIGEDAFDGNPATKVQLDYIEKIDCDIFGSSASTIQNVCMDMLKDFGDNTFRNFTSLSEVKLNSFENVPDYCFKGLKNLKNATIPVAQSIGSEAFYNCTELSILTIDSVKTIAENAFYNCIGLTEVYADGIEELDLSVFDGCSNLYILSLNSLKELPTAENGSPLGNMAGLEMFYAGAVTEVPANTFRNLANLHTVSVPNATVIGDYAFANTALDTIYSAAVTIGSYAFLNTPLMSFSSGARYVGEGAFKDCSTLSNVTFGDLLTIGDMAFKNCSSLNKITTNGLNSVDIGAQAFYNCSKLNVLSNITPESIGSKALYGTLSDTTKTYEIPELLYIESDAFDNFKCGNLILENVEEIYDVPDHANVLIGTDVISGGISNTTTATIYSPAGSAVSKYCIENGVNYVEFNETNPILINTSDTVSAYSEKLTYSALGFNLEYNWYACNEEDMSDAVLVKSNVKYYTPFTTNTIGTERDYKYYYCVATSTENGNVVDITSNLVHNTYMYVYSLNDKNEFWEDTSSANEGYIYSQEKNIDAVRDNIYFEEGACEFVPSFSHNDNDFYGTGTIINVYVNDEVKHKYTLILDGDINGDGYVDVLDCSVVASAVNGHIEITDENCILAGSYFDGVDEFSAIDYQAVVNKAIS